jgi:hypothetical protein
MSHHVVDVLTGAWLGDPVIHRNGWFLPVPEGRPSAFIPKLPIALRELIQHDGEGTVVLHVACREDLVTETGDGPLVMESRDWNPALGAVEVVRTRSWPPIGQLKAAKKEALAQRRFEVETGGLMLGGVLVRTDRESQALITGKQLYLDKVPTATEVRWKAESGWVTIPREPFEQIAVAVAEHVQICFDREGELAAAIDAIAEDDEAAARTALDAIDVHAFWPIE